MSLARPLLDNELAAEFVIGILGLTNDGEIDYAVQKIVQAELQLSTINRRSKSTIDSSSYRCYSFSTEEKRRELHEQIFNDLISKPRLDNEDDIRLGEGGALPKEGQVMAQKQAVIITGPPASGKSGVSNIIADHYGAVILDSDYAKRKLPEYAQDYGASLLHEESQAIIFGNKPKYEGKNLLEACLTASYNIIIPKIGSNPKSLVDFATILQEENYSVHLLLVSLDRVKATQRAYRRYIETKRYVPLPLVFDVYSNEPILTYYRVKDNPCWSSYGKISSDVPKGSPYKVIEIKANNPARLFKRDGE